MARATEATIGPVVLVLRPEHLIPLTGQPNDDTNIFATTVRDIVYQGDAILFSMELSDGTKIMMRKGCNSRNDLGSIRIGDSLKVGLHRDDAVVVADEDSRPQQAEATP